MASEEDRFVVSDLGFAFAVHDTQVTQEYAFDAGRESDHKSNNRANGRRVEICATREMAQAIADRMNEQARRAG